MTKLTTINSGVLSELFTISFLLDKNLQISQISPLLGRYAPELRSGMELQNAFELIRPRNLNGSNLRLKLQMIFLMVSKVSRYPIRGQIVELNDDSFILCGSPWLSRMADDHIHEYELKDFPLHDAQLDWLFMLSAKKQQVGDLERLSHDLEVAKKEAEAAVESKSDFFAVMSHEMRTPLNAIIGSINLMPRETMNSEQLELLDISVSAAHQLLTVINDVLDYSKMEAGKLELEMSEFSLGNVIRDVIAIVNPIASTKGLQLIVEQGEINSQFVVGDNGKIKQVLLNLLTNAIKFTESGSVSLQVAERPSNDDKSIIEFRVVDTGIGVTEEDMDKLFQQFWTSSISQGFHGRGTGLGLDIARRMTELMGGKIACESVIGEGSTFSIALPMELISSPSTRDSIQTTWKGEIEKLSGKRILVAEDNQANQIIARISLEKCGIVVDIANNGLEVIEAIRRAPYDAILMDIGMPEMNGIEATKIIRHELDIKDLPIVACTAHPRSMDSLSWSNEGFSAYVGKPIDRDQLLKVLVGCLVNDSKISQTEEQPSSSLKQSSGANQQQELIDLNALEQLRADLGDENMQAALSALLLELDSRRDTILKACADKSFTHLAAEAHALKSSASSFGATHLANLVKRLEASAAASDPTAFALSEGVITSIAATHLAYSKI